MTTNKDTRLRHISDGDDDMKKPFNTALESGHTDDVMYGEKHPGGCRLTRVRALLLLLLVVLCVVVTAMLVALVTRCDNAPPAAAVLTKSAAREDDTESTPAPVTQQDSPWAEIRLPRSVIPKRYVLSLTIDMQRFTFSGYVEIDVNITQTTSYVLLHVNGLVINHTSNYILDLSDNPRLVDIIDVRVLEDKQFLVLVSAERLLANRKYKVVLSDFRGDILDDLRGLYRSSYMDKQGQQR